MSGWLLRLQALAAWAASPWRLAGGFAGVLAGSALFFWPGSPADAALLERLRAPMFDTRFGGYDAAEVAAAWRLWGADGLAHYLRMRWVDAFYPACYGLFFLGSLWRGLARWPRGRLTALGLAALLVLLDYAENTALIALLLERPRVDAGLVAVASALTRLKWLLVPPVLAACVAALLVALLVALATRLRQRYGDLSDAAQ